MELQSQPFTIIETTWADEANRLSDIRRTVFMEEQNVPASLEWDGLDASATHLLAIDANDQAIGCARILSHGSIGRMAVLQHWRRRGVGHALLESAIEICRRQGVDTIRLSAQTYAIHFYARFGFEVCSDEYLDAGIPHRDMQLSLSQGSEPSIQHSNC